MQIKALYTCSEVAKMLGVNVRTIQRWIKAERLKSVRVGHSPMVPISSLYANAEVWDSLVLAAKLSNLV